MQVMAYSQCVLSKDNVSKGACDKEFQALKACIQKAVSAWLYHDIWETMRFIFLSNLVSIHAPQT